jgi:hypothetical protein
MATCGLSAAKEMLQSWESRRPSGDSCRRTYVQEGSRRMQERRRLLGQGRAGGAFFMRPLRDEAKCTGQQIKMIGRLRQKGRTVDGRAGDDIRHNEGKVVGRDEKVLVDNDDEAGAVDDRVVGRLGEDGAVGLDRRAGVVRGERKRGVRDVQLRDPGNEKLLQ